MSNIRTNIVPVEEQTAEEQQLSQDTYNMKLGEDAIKYLHEEFKEHINPKFWEGVYNYCASMIKKDKTDNLMPFEPEAKTFGIEPADTSPEMSEDQKKKFLKEDLPWGRYAGMKVATILKKDRSALEKMALNPLPFQVRLRKFLKSADKK